MTYSMFEGKKVRLRGVRPEDWQHFLHWDVDSDAQRYGWQVWPPVGEEGAKEFAKQESLKKPTDGNARFIIETLDSEPVGSINTRVDARRFSPTFSNQTVVQVMRLSAGGQRLRVRPAAEQLRRDRVHPPVGRLGRQDSGDEQLEGIAEVELAACLGVGEPERLVDRLRLGHQASTTSSTSTGEPSGSSATPTALRTCTPASPNTSCSSREAPLATAGWPVNPGALAT